MRAISVQTLTVGNTSVSLTIPSGATDAFMRVEDADIRFEVDGTTPTSSNGFLVYNGEPINYNKGFSLGGFRAIRATNTDAKLTILYYNRHDNNKGFLDSGGIL